MKNTTLSATGTRTGTARALPLIFLSVTALHAQTVTTVATFDGPNGIQPESSLIQGTDGDFYGTTYGSKF